MVFPVVTDRAGYYISLRGQVEPSVYGRSHPLSGRCRSVAIFWDSWSRLAGG